MKNKKDVTKTGQPRILIRDGRLWFTREMERRFYFILTLIMLAAGMSFKLGWFK
ncbi:MAG: hypothetical protein WBY88_01110 [Desulfosarcina sp.]